MRHRRRSHVRLAAARGGRNRLPARRGGGARLGRRSCRARSPLAHLRRSRAGVEGDRVRLRIDGAAGVAHAGGVDDRCSRARSTGWGATSAALPGRGRNAAGDVSTSVDFLEGGSRSPTPGSSSAITSGSSPSRWPSIRQGAAVVVHPRLVELADAVQRRRAAGRFRPPTAPAAAGRLRLPLGARVHAGRVSAPRALADHGASRAADGEGARRHSTRHGRGAPRLRSGRGVRQAGGLELRRSRARGRLRPARCTRAEGGRLLSPPPVRAARSSRCRRFVEGFRAMLGVLAAAEPDARTKLARWLVHEQTRTAQAGELVVVTANLEPAAVDALLALATRRLLSVVWIDAPSYAGRPTRTPPGPLRLRGCGIPVAVVRRGDDLAGGARRTSGGGSGGCIGAGRSSPGAARRSPSRSRGCGSSLRPRSRKPSSWWLWRCAGARAVRVAARARGRRGGAGRCLDRVRRRAVGASSVPGRARCRADRERSRTGRRRTSIASSCPSRRTRPRDARAACSWRSSASSSPSRCSLPRRSRSARPR